MKRSKKVISIMAIVALLVSGSGLTRSANASSFTSASDRLSTSATGTAATHNFSFVNKTAMAAGDYVDITLPVDFGDINLATDITCSNGNRSLVSPTVARCTMPAGLAADSTTTVAIANVTNPVYEGSQTIGIQSIDISNSNAVLDRAEVMVAVIGQVTINVTVRPTLTFTISPLSSSTPVNGATTTLSSATTTLNFGTLEVGTSSIMGQKLRVTTNADYGFKVTVEQNQNLTSNNGSDINSFKDSVTSVTAQAWTSPTGVLDNFATYGHMGVTTNDSTLSQDQFGSDQWKGFSGVNPMEVMWHDGPADGASSTKGMADIAYRIQISPLQEAGDYTNILTYIATPIY